MASSPVFMFCAPELIFGGTNGVRTLFRRCGGRPDAFLTVPMASTPQLPLSYFALPDSFSTVPRASGPIFMFCPSELVFGNTDDVSFRFHVLRPQTRFRRYRANQVPFSYFAIPDSFFTGTEGVGSHLHILRGRIRFRRDRSRLHLFLCFALPDTFSTVRRVSGPVFAPHPVFLFCAPRHFFGDTEGV
jgi:hypothetical protein